MLRRYFKNNCLEAGLDEAGRGCLAGPVFAAAVILPEDFSDKNLRDSKLLNAAQRDVLRNKIEQTALAFSVQWVHAQEIDRLNILKASVKAMHQCIKTLKIKPEHLIIDGNYFIPFKNLPFQTVVKGDNTYASIAAASVLAKTYRDEFMLGLHRKFPQYQWANNKGYGTAAHVEAIKSFGLTRYHRKTFQVKSLQTSLF